MNSRRRISALQRFVGKAYSHPGRIGTDADGCLAAPSRPNRTSVSGSSQTAGPDRRRRADAKLHNAVAENIAEMIEGKRAMVVQLQADIAELETARVQSTTEAATAEDRVSRLQRGEDVPGGLGKPIDPVQVLRSVGATDAEIRHMRVVAAMTEATHESYFEEDLRQMHVANERRERAMARRFLRTQEGAKEE
jgi:hypothetical protein